MRKKYNNLKTSLNLDSKTSEAIKILMEEGLLEPLLVDLKTLPKLKSLKIQPNKAELNSIHSRKI